MRKHIQMRNDFSINPLTFLVKNGPSLCNIGAVQRFRLWLQKIRPIVAPKHLNIQGGLRVLLDIEMRRLRAGLVGVYLLGRISSFTPIVERKLSATQEGGSYSSIGDEKYTQVIEAERHGRVRGYGLGPTPTLGFGSMSRQSQAAFDEVRTELKAQCMKWEKNQEEEKRAHVEEMKLMHAIIAEMGRRLSAQRQDPSKGIAMFCWHHIMFFSINYRNPLLYFG